MTQLAPHKPPASNALKIVVIIVAVLFAVAIGIRVLAIFAISGVRRYVADSKLAEAKSSVPVLARGIAECGKKALPPSSRKVPASLAQVTGGKYLSAPTDWSSDPAFACAKFELSQPQYFQYEWDLTQPGKQGTVRATGSIDGDGSVVTEEMDVTCAAPGSCAVGPLREARK